MTTTQNLSASVGGSLPSMFESGVSDYFRDFGHRVAREAPHQAWLLISVAKYIAAEHVIAELQVPNQDLRPFVELKDTNGAVNFDFAISHSEIDLRTWKSKTIGWKQGTSTVPRTLKTLEAVAVLAELKIAKSTSTTRKTLVHDIRKLAAAMRFMDHNKCKSFPMCYFVILDPDRQINVEQITKLAGNDWPKFAPFPKIIVGPNTQT